MSGVVLKKGYTEIGFEELQDALDYLTYMEATAVGPLTDWTIETKEK